MYYGLLRMPTPDDVEIIAYADDIAIVVKASVTLKVGELLEETAKVIVDWLDDIEIELALDKTELIIPTRKVKYNNLQASVKGQSITSPASIKYLGVHRTKGPPSIYMHRRLLRGRAEPSSFLGESCRT